MSNLPVGTITFLFSDIEGNTPLWEKDPQAMDAAIQIHHAILRQVIAANGGVIFKIVGDEFQAAFPTAPQALLAALQAQLGLLSASWNELGPLRVRMGIHTGEAHLDEHGDEYAVSHTKNRGHRVMEAGHGGQILLSQESADLCQRNLPHEVILKDLGEHHIRNWKLPEHFYQVVATDLPKDFPPLRTQAEPKHNLPVQLTSFVGREKEIEDIKAFLCRDESVRRPFIPSRLVTLTGVGGTGKTRLALQVAEDLVDEFPDGLWLIELAHITDPALIPHTAATVFGLRDEKGRSAAEMLDNYLHLKRLLLILDNCEHLINEAAQFADHILHLAPGVKILATSREALGLAGETIHLVPSLGKPDLDQLPPIDSLTQYEAVRLFIDRAVAVLPSFTMTNTNAPAVAQICHRLDGIPLAIELAAARAKALSVEQIAARLNDRFRLLTGGSRTALPRQQTLQATIDWSYGLLSEPERALFRCLSVFTGGWSLEAAEAVSTAASSLDPDSALELLSQLVNKSMVVADTEEGLAYRYRMLETIRQYAQQKLIEADEAARARNQHLAYFLAFAEEMESQFKTFDQISAFDHLDLEINNIHSAVNWAFDEEAGNRALLGLRLVTAIGLYLEFKSIYESIEWLKKGLSLLQGEDELHNRVRAAAYLYMGVRYSDVNIPEAKRWLHKSVDLYRSLRDAPGLAFALAYMGDIYAILDPLRGSFSTDMETAWACCKESEAIFREIHDTWGMRWISTMKFVLFYFAKDYASLQQMEVENRDAFQDSLGRVLPEFHSVLVLGLGAFEQEDYQRSYFYFHRYMELSRKLRVKNDVAYGLGGMGMSAFAQGDFQRMAEHFEEALPLFRETGFDFYSNWALRCLSVAALAQGQVERARNYLLESMPKDQGQENVSEMVFFLLHAAGVSAAESHTEFAAKLLGMINIQCESIVANDRMVGEKVFLQWITAFVRSHLDEAAFAAAWEAGKAMDLKQAVEYALQVVNSRKIDAANTN